MIDIKLKGAKNIRDLGGTVCAGGHTIKPRRFIRGAELSRITESDIARLEKDCKVRMVIDLRTDKEVEEKPDRLISRLAFAHVPIVSEATMGFTHERGTDSPRGLARVPAMETLYRNIIGSDYSVQQLKKALRAIIAGTENGAVMWHCTVGKDRCGILTALVLYILGADMETIYRDYLLTNRVSQSKSNLCVAVARIITLNKNETVERVRGIYTAKRSFLEAAFREMERISGSVDLFIQEKLGVTEADIIRLKEFAFN